MPRIFFTRKTVAEDKLRKVVLFLKNVYAGLIIDKFQTTLYTKYYRRIIQPDLYL